MLFRSQGVAELEEPSVNMDGIKLGKEENIKEEAENESKGGEQSLPDGTEGI